MVTEANLPTDQDILDAVRKYGNRAITSVAASILRQKFGNRFSTAWVRVRLFRLEADGYVKRVPSSYRVQHCWSCTEMAP